MGVCGINVCVFLFFYPIHPSCSGVLFSLTREFSSFIVTFRMIVFRPFVSEVLLAKVKSSDEDGIRSTFLSILSTPTHHFLL